MSEPAESSSAPQQQSIALADVEGFSPEELRAMPMALRLWFDPRMSMKVERLAKMMARGECAVPKHLRGKEFACASVVRSSMLWRLNPDGVALSTFETPGGVLGYMGRLCNAILQVSGALTPGQVPTFEHVGDWSKVTRKFRMTQSSKSDNEYPVPTWTDNDANDLGVYVHIPLLDREPLRFPGDEPFWLAQCFPRFSTLWATDPKTQICYTVMRRAINVALPAIMLGVPFDDDAFGEPVPQMREVNPRPASVRPPAQLVEAWDADGAQCWLPPGEVDDWIARQLEGLGQDGDAIDAFVSSNQTIADRIDRHAFERHTKSTPRQAARKAEATTSEDDDREGQDTSAASGGAPAARVRYHFPGSSRGEEGHGAIRDTALREIWAALDACTTHQDIEHWHSQIRPPLSEWPDVPQGEVEAAMNTALRRIDKATPEAGMSSDPPENEPVRPRLFQLKDGSGGTQELTALAVVRHLEDKVAVGRDRGKLPLHLLRANADTLNALAEAFPEDLKDRCNDLLDVIAEQES